MDIAIPHGPHLAAPESKGRALLALAIVASAYEALQLLSFKFSGLTYPLGVLGCLLLVLSAGSVWKDMYCHIRDKNSHAATAAVTIAMMTLTAVIAIAGTLASVPYLSASVHVAHTIIGCVLTIILFCYWYDEMEFTRTLTIRSLTRKA